MTALLYVYSGLLLLPVLNEFFLRQLIFLQSAWEHIYFDLFQNNICNTVPAKCTVLYFDIIYCFQECLKMKMNKEENTE